MVCLQPIVRKASAVLLTISLSSSLAVFAQQAPAPKFLADDPLQRVPQVPVPGKPTVQQIDELYDFAYYSAKYKRPKPTPSLGINSLGEVPDSAWYTNRHASHRMSREELKRGARKSGPPVAPFTVVAAKTEGVSPGFRMQDAQHRLFFVKVDPPSNPEMATAADVMGALFFYALGYNVPENYILNAPPEAFHLSKKASITTATGKKYAMTEQDLRKIMDAVPRTADHQVRVMASLATPGRIMGPFRYEGTRSDDPNDIIPHEQRRDLRGLNVFCAWTNHTDAKSLNSMDTLEGEGKDAHFKHFLLDFGAAFGSDSDIAKDPRHGREFFTPSAAEQVHQLYTLGLRPPDWQTVHYPGKLAAAGNFTADAFVPAEWRSNYPNPAFQAMLPGDAIWAAEKVMAFTDDDIQAIVEEGKFSNPAVTRYITQVLIERRDKIGRAWHGSVPPIQTARIVDDRLSFGAPGAQNASSYQVHWFRWNNQEGREEPLASPQNGLLPSELNSVEAGSYIGCAIGETAQTPRQATLYFRRSPTGWHLVGINRDALSQAQPGRPGI